MNEPNIRDLVMIAGDPSHYIKNIRVDEDGERWVHIIGERVDTWVNMDSLTRGDNIWILE